MKIRFMKIMLDEGAYMPEKAHSSDAGYDLRAVGDRIIPAGASALIDTGVHFQIPEGYCGELISKSGLNCKHDITSTGLIDAGYTGSVKVKLYNHGQKPYQVYDGDKISQIIFYKIESPDLEIVEAFEQTDRGDNGFGSSGR